MSWHEALQKSLTTADELADVLKLSPGETARYAEIIERFPMMVTPYYLSLSRLDDPDDPIRKMCIPSPEEFDVGGDFDTSGEADNTVLEGVQHKYRETVLLLSTNLCAMYCRHCFRKRLVGLTNDELNRRVDDAVGYVKAHKEISNVLISGGDSFMNSNAIIERYLRELSQIEHLDLIRFGSRVPVTFPERIYDDPEFLDIFNRYAKKKSLYLITQFNHPREFTDEALRAIRALKKCGVGMKNQTVLLRGVNDDPATLSELLKALTRFGISPYYVFQCRPVTGVKGRFQVPLLEGCRIVDEAKSRQNGLGKNMRYAMSHPRGKIELLGEIESGEMLFKFQQNKYPEDAARIFTRRLSPDDCWLDEDLNGV